MDFPESPNGTRFDASPSCEPLNGLSRRSALAGVAAFVASASGGHLRAQTSYPSRPIRMILPIGPGVDVIARLWADRLAKATGQAVIVENRPGAATIIGTQAVATAPADGYTLLYTIPNTFSVNPFMYKKLPYKAGDFVPVVRVLSMPYVVVVSGESKIRTLQDLIREAKAKPDALTYASAGVGTGLHVAMARLLNEAGVTMVHVPYKDYFGPEVISQRVDVAFDATYTALPQIKAGKLRPLAVSSPKRIESLPDVPTIAETFPGFVGDSWQGIFVRKGTPNEVIATLVSHSHRIIYSPEFRASLRDYGLTPVGGTSEEFSQFLAEDAKVWSKVVKDNNIRMD